MDVNIQSLKFDADKKLIDFIREKVSKLDKFSDDITSAEAVLRLDKDTENGNKVAVLKLFVTGGELVAERRSKTFEEAVDTSIDALKKQLAKHKGRFDK